ncbi:MAG: NAD-dependent epimerase/dehydratase family protein [Christensenellales bacterium]|jgi:nucleoside-diphosphate-sugar epimerase
MKRVLITGANSYIGTSVEKYLAQWPDQYQVDTIDMIDGSWREKSFAGYDSVFHVAGIAHISTRKLNHAAREKYWTVNTILPVEVARKAKEEYVKQFVFLSSMSVYGEHGSIENPVIITCDTLPKPKNIYGESKLAAEEELKKIQSPDFSVAILRPPMVYGPGCKGNYQTLIKGAQKLPFFPNIENQRSMLHIENLCKFVKELIDGEVAGMYFPQDERYICTSEMVRKLAKEFGRNIILTKMFNPFLRLLSGRVALVDKVFGSLVYAEETRKQFIK